MKLAYKILIGIVTVGVIGTGVVITYNKLNEKNEEAVSEDVIQNDDAIGDLKKEIQEEMQEKLTATEDKEEKQSETKVKTETTTQTQTPETIEESKEAVMDTSKRGSYKEVLLAIDLSNYFNSNESIAGGSVIVKLEGVIVSIRTVSRTNPHITINVAGNDTKKCDISINDTLYKSITINFNEDTTINL